MKKKRIEFEEENYKLASAVLKGKKTQTRLLVKPNEDNKYNIGEELEVTNTNRSLIVTNVSKCNLQDITEEECIKEGIRKECENSYKYGRSRFSTAREAFADLVNGIYNRDVWSENPEVWVYEFVLAQKIEYISVVTKMGGLTTKVGWKGVARIEYTGPVINPETSTAQGDGITTVSPAKLIRNGYYSCYSEDDRLISRITDNTPHEVGYFNP